MAAGGGTRSSGGVGGLWDTPCPCPNAAPSPGFPARGCTSWQLMWGLEGVAGWCSPALVEPHGGVASLNPHQHPSLFPAPHAVKSLKLMGSSSAPSPAPPWPWAPPWLLHKPTGHHGRCRSIPGTEPPCRPQGTPLLLLPTEGFIGICWGPPGTPGSPRPLPKPTCPAAPSGSTDEE